LCPWEESWDTSVLASNNQLSDPLQEAKDSYMKTLGQDELQQKLNQECDINFTYTAMHGVGYLYMEEAFRTAKFKVQIFFFQALNFLIESFGLLNDLFPFPLILDAGYPLFDLYLADVLFDVILPSLLGSFL
jgi:hypothetical protein